MNIIKDYIPRGRPNRPGFSIAPKWITAHDTGNASTGADAISHARYLKGDAAAKATVSWHFTVDEKKIVQHLPLNESGFHAGDGAGPGNRQSIGIEICMNAGGDRLKAEANAAALIAHLISTERTLLKFPECVKQHFDWSGKDCPQVLRRRPNGWKNFLAEVERVMTPVPAINIIFNGRRADGITARPKDGKVEVLLGGQWVWIRDIVNIIPGATLGWNVATQTVDVRVPSPGAKIP